MTNRKKLGELNRSEIADNAIHDLAYEFFGHLKPTDKALKTFLSHDGQRLEFIKWVDRLVKEWAENSEPLESKNNENSL